jgi:hypothetical protein
MSGFGYKHETNLGYGIWKLILMGLDSRTTGKKIQGAVSPPTQSEALLERLIRDFVCRVQRHIEADEAYQRPAEQFMRLSG